jgi:hypothetical protein
MIAAVRISTGQIVKLGRIRPVARKPTHRLTSYLHAMDASVLPDSVDYTKKAMASLTQMFLNDSEGDCVIAGVGHAEGVASGAETGTPVVATNAEIKAIYREYSLFGGGCVITQVLDGWRAKGFMLGGQLRKIDGYVAVDFTNPIEVKAAIYEFTSVKIGINLPSAWESSDTWDVTNTRIVGGHDVELCGWNPTGPLVSTWGSIRQMTWAALASPRFVDEMYAVLYPDLYSVGGVSPLGVDRVQMLADQAKISTGGLPDIQPLEPPPPVVPPDPNGPKQPPALMDVIAALTPLWP